jgi:hypothetical protein
MNGELFYGTEGEDIYGYGGEDIYGYESEDIYGYNGEEYPWENYYEPEAAEARYSRSRAARDARARRATKDRMMAKARYARRSPMPRPRPPQRPGYPPAPTGPSSTAQVLKTDVQRTKAAIRNVDLDTKVQADMTARTFAIQGKRISRNEQALAASTVAGLIKDEFSTVSFLQNPIVRAAIPFAPLLFLNPPRSGGGFRSVVSDPRVWGPALGIAVIALKEFQGSTDKTVTQLKSSGNVDISVNQDFFLKVEPINAEGKTVSDKQLIYISSDTEIVEVANGVLKGKKGGTAEITVIERESGVEQKIKVAVNERG